MRRIAACVWVLGTLMGSVLAEPVLEWAPTPEGPWTPDLDATVIELGGGGFRVLAPAAAPARFYRLVESGVEMTHCPLYVTPALMPAVEIGFVSRDLDSDGDTVPDCDDLCPGHDDRIDENGNGIPDQCDGPEERMLTLPGGVPLVLVRIPAGGFQMGSPNSERSREMNEGPAHTVTIAYDFYMGKYEVTQAQWLALMGSWPGPAPSPSNGVGPMCPVYYVNWNEAKDFIKAFNDHIATTGQGPLTLRLPSEAEWEYACRAGTETRFFFGDSLGLGDDCGDDGQRSLYMWYCGNNDPPGAKPVGMKIPNAFGLYDMHGNVWEWCEDWWHDDYTGAPGDGSARTIPPALYRALRSGCWDIHAGRCRSTFRTGNTPTNRYYYLGFRLAAVE